MQSKSSILKSVLYSLLLISLHSCVDAQHSAYSMENKGLACDALINGNGEMLMTGEISSQAIAQSEKPIKSGLISVLKYGSEDGHQFILSDGANPFRIDQCENSNEGILFSGYGLESKKPLIFLCDKNMKLKWAKVSDQLQPLGKPFLCANAKGESIIATRLPSSTAYYNYFTLTDKVGKEIWTKRLDHIDVLSDIIYSTADQFLIHFVAKGAYIEERKKYYNLPLIRCNTKGISENSFVMHIDRDVYPQITSNKILEASNGDLYFFGSLSNAEKRMDLLVIKTTAKGELLWSKAYQTNKDLEIKSAMFDENQDIIFVADSYGRKGGFLYVRMNKEGIIQTNDFHETKPFEQVKKILNNRDKKTLFYDKVLNFAFIEYSKDHSCSGMQIEIKSSPIEVLIYKEPQMMEDADLSWRHQELSIKEKGKYKLKQDCVK